VSLALQRYESVTIFVQGPYGRRVAVFIDTLAVAYFYITGIAVRVIVIAVVTATACRAKTVTILVFAGYFTAIGIFAALADSSARIGTGLSSCVTSGFNHISATIHTSKQGVPAFAGQEMRVLGGVVIRASFIPAA